MINALPITVVIPTIPPRSDLLAQAVDSVRMQTQLPTAVIIEQDLHHEGAGVTRTRALQRVTTPWVAFLDDDDLFMPQHLERLWEHKACTDCDYAYSWFETLPAGGDPFPPTHFTEPWDPAAPRQTTVTTLVRRQLAQEVGFLGDPRETNDGMRAGEDWWFTLECNRLGVISHLAEKTWYWRHWGFGQRGVPGNTSGLGSRW